MLVIGVQTDEGVRLVPVLLLLLLLPLHVHVVAVAEAGAGLVHVVVAGHVAEIAVSRVDHPSSIALL